MGGREFGGFRRGTTLGELNESKQFSPNTVLRGHTGRRARAVQAVGRIVVLQPHVDACSSVDRVEKTRGLPLRQRSSATRLSVVVRRTVRMVPLSTLSGLDSCTPVPSPPQLPPPRLAPAVQRLRPSLRMPRTASSHPLDQVLTKHRRYHPACPLHPSYPLAACRSSTVLASAPHAVWIATQGGGNNPLLQMEGWVWPKPPFLEVGQDVSR